MNAPATAAASNPFGSKAVAERASNAVAETDQQRAIAETQAAMIIAKRFPRDQIAAMDRILQACTRQTLAEQALYTYARGGTDITGPSIRMAEALAQSWGNIQFGIRELEQRNGESSVEAFAWDIETNAKQVKVFQVPHLRYTKSGTKRLEDPRDIYEMVANQGARRLRACILGIIPGDVIEAAVNQCETTLNTKAEITPERLASLVEKFAVHGVTKEMIEQRIQRRLDAMTPALLVQLGKIYNSLKDGMSQPSEWFEVATVTTDTTAKPATGTDALKAAINRTKPAAAVAPGPDEDPTLGIAGAGDISHVGGADAGKPKVEYETLLKRLQSFTDQDVGDADAAVIGEVVGQDLQNNLVNAWKARTAELLKGKGKK